MHRPARLVVPATLALALVLAGCGGGDGGDGSKEPEADGGTSTSPSPSASPSASTSQSETAEPEEEPASSGVLDPCAMVPEQTWKAVLPKPRRSHAVVERTFATSIGILITDTRLRYACSVGYDDRPDADPAMLFGYYPGEFTAQDLKELLDSPAATTSPGRPASPRRSPATSARPTPSGSSAPRGCS